MATNNMTRCFTLLLIREMQMKPMGHFTPKKMAILKKTDNNKYW